eukprot:403346370
MQRASNKAYVSKRLITKYKEQKNQSVPLQENEMIQPSSDLALKMEIDDGQQIQPSMLTQPDQSKARTEIQKPSNLFALKEEEDEDDDSAESMDSDDLGDQVEDHGSHNDMLMLQQQLMFQEQQQQPPQKEKASLFGGLFSGSLFKKSEPQQQQQQRSTGFFGGKNAQPSSSLFGKQMPQQQQMQNSMNAFGAQQQPYQMQHMAQMQPQPQNMFGASNISPPQYNFGNNQLNMNQNVQNFNDNNFGLPLGQQMQPQQKLKKEKRRKYKQEVDTNVFKISMECLKDQGELATGDPVFCGSCQAVLNKHSKIEDVKQNEEQIWTCEFCNAKNKVQLEPEEIPQTEAVNYMIEAAAQVYDKKNEGTVAKDITVIFCIDISGSMCVSLPVQGHHQLRGDRIKGLKDELMKFGDGSDQRLQGDHNTTYVSRLQCVQSAIEKQIEDMKIHYPERKIGLVTFNNEVTVIGDGMQIPQTIAGDKLYNFDYLLQNGIESQKLYLNKPIKETKSKLEQKLLSLEEGGPTALGPAVLTAIAMASEGAPGSSVILCTDGLANVGLGNFDEVFTEEENQKVDEIYERMGQYAKSKGLTVNIVSIEGEECNIDTISKISEITGGEVQRVKPADLIENFSNILSLPVLATNVQLKVKIHKGLQFRNEDPQNLSGDKTILGRDLGNVNEQTEVTFEYKLKKLKDLLEMKDIDLELIKNFPFQAQITYTTLDGARCVRVITNLVEISDDKEELQKDADFDILGVNAIQQTAKMARQGNVVQAQVNAKAWSRHLERNVTDHHQVEQLQNFRGNVNEMYGHMNQQRQKTQQQMLQPQFMLGAPSNIKSAQMNSVKPRYDDSTSHSIFSGSRMNTQALQKKKK